SRPRLPWPEGFYSPTWVEIGITLGFGTTFMFLYMLFTRFFPIVSIWEVQEGRERALPDVVARVRSYMPGGILPASAGETSHVGAPKPES
ncbi:MAG: hypothetical protein HY508_15650, partial [Acidobacteria bacterium]|nr:hypothetical protein [Acidobacteriota bacterium]